LLDFGAGNGALVAEASRLQWGAVGLDLNQGLVAAANEHWGFDLLISKHLDDFAVDHLSQFDVITSNQVFEHLCDPVSIGDTLVSMLRPGGVLHIDVPNVYQLRERFTRGKTLDPTAHLNHFSLVTLKKLMIRIGCRIVYASAAPSLVRFYHRLGFRRSCYALGRLTRRILPPVGTGVCVIGKKD